MMRKAMFNEEFDRWYRCLNLGTAQETLEKRRAGTAALVKQTTVKDIEALVRVAFKSRHTPSAEALARLRKPFQVIDDSFPTEGNDRELQILAGAALAELFRRDHDASPAAALAVSTASALGMRQPGLPLDLAQAADASLASLSETTRMRPDLDKLAAPDFPKSELDKVAAKVQGQFDVNGVVSAFKTLTEAAHHAHTMLWKRLSDGLAAAGSFIRIQDEELNMLWWLTGERSADLDQSFIRIPEDKRPLVLAKELAVLTTSLPGPSAVKPLLARSGVSEGKEFTIPACVNACDEDWLLPLVDGAEPSPVTRPLHFAIRRKLEVGDNISWITAWAATTGLDAEKKFSGLLISLLFYRERLLAQWHLGS